VLTHLVDRLQDPESRFHSSLVTNVLDLTDLLPKLNVSQDEELNRFAADIRTRLAAFTAQDLRKSEILRVATAHDAAGILNQMNAVLREREEQACVTSSPTPLQNVADIFSHMSAYMETAEA
jgi:hypothetical protein